MAVFYFEMIYIFGMKNRYMKKFALIVAGGMGSRMENPIPKQFIDLLGNPILMHTIRVFYHFDKEMEIIVVLPKDQQSLWQELCAQHRFPIKHRIVAGGENRFTSVKNGLETITEEGIVFIHDGVRPLVSMATLDRCLSCTEENSNAIPVMQVTESLRKVTRKKSKAVNRSKYFNVQTPQTFIVSAIKNAYRQNYNEEFTDDASVLEKAGQHIFTVEGNHENIKITRPLDLSIAEALIRHAAMEI